MATRLELVKELAERAGITADGGPSTTISQSGAYLKAVNYIDTAYQEVQNLHFDWHFLWATSTITTVSGTADYSGEADLHILDANRVFYDGQPLDVINWNDYVPPSSAVSGVPSQAILRPDGRVRLYPTPDDAYTISYDYFKVPDVMSADADEPIMPAQFHRVILGRALILYANYEAAEEAKIQGQEIYQQYLARLEQSQLPRRAQISGRHEGIDVVVRCE